MAYFFINKKNNEDHFHMQQIYHVVQHLCNYNITYHKLETPIVKMRLVSAGYTSGRGISKNIALLHFGH